MRTLVSTSTQTQAETSIVDLMSTGQDTRNPDEQTLLIVSPEPSNAKRFAMSGETFWKVGAIYGATAVALGAFGAHGLKKVIADPAKIGNWSTAAEYQVLFLG